MELVVTITCLTIVVILQIIILANQQKNAKLIREFIANRAKAHHERDHFNERRDNNFKQNRSNQQQHGGVKSTSAPPSSAPAANVDNVEKSLRDINLKLKNAERDQEAARRKIHDTMGNPQQRPRQNRDNRGNNKDSHRRDRNNRNNWRNKNEGERSLDTAPQYSEEHPANEVSEPQNIAEINSTTVPTSLPELNPVDFDNDLQHGRKFAVKRRMLPDEVAAVGQSEIAEDRANVPEQQPFTPPQEQQEQPLSNDAEISFGRR